VGFFYVLFMAEKESPARIVIKIHPFCSNTETTEAKTMNENNSNYDALIKKGILISRNEICQDKINLISGAITAPLLETAWTFSGCNIETINRISNFLTHLYSEDRGNEMLDILRILYDVVSMEFPEDVDLLVTHQRHSNISYSPSCWT